MKLLSSRKARIIVRLPKTKCIAIRADVTSEADMQRAVEETVKQFGRIDYAA